MSVLGSADLARYPFIEQAGELVRGLDIGYYETHEGMAMVERAAEAIVKSSWPEMYDGSMRVKLFLTVMILLKIANIDRLTKRTSLAIAKRMEWYMIQDMRQHNCSSAHMVGILKDELGIEVSYRPMLDSCKYCVAEKETVERNAAKRGERISFANSSACAVSLFDFLKLAAYFRTERWTLEKRRVHGGYVFLSNLEEAIKLARSLIDRKIQDRISVMKLPTTIPASLFVAARRLADEHVPQVTQVSTGGTMSPCAKHCLSILEKGENLPHSGRVFLASYLTAMGKSVDEVVDVFRNAPDFSESVTKYQVEYLAKKREDGRGYGVTGCDKLKSFGYCFADSGCTGIRNPMSYGNRNR